MPQYIDPFLVHRGRFAIQLRTATRRRSTLHEMMTARRPVWGDGRTAPEHTAGPAALAADGLDPSVRRPQTKFFERALQREAAERFDTAEDMLSAWRAVFARIDAPRRPEHALGDDERRALIETAELHTPLVRAGPERGPSGQRSSDRTSSSSRI